MASNEYEKEIFAADRSHANSFEPNRIIFTEKHHIVDLDLISGYGEYPFCMGERKMKIIKHTILVSVVVLVVFSFVSCDKSKPQTDKQEQTQELNSVEVESFKATIDIGKPVKAGSHPVFPIWKTVQPIKKRGCVARQGTEVDVLQEAQFGNSRYYQIKTPKCTGYIKAEYIKPKN